VRVRGRAKGPTVPARHSYAPLSGRSCAMVTNARILGRLLVDTEGVGEAALSAALGAERRPGERVGDTLVRCGAISRCGVARALAAQLDLPLAPMPLEPEPDALAAVQAELARRRAIVPLAITRRVIRLAMADPLDVIAIDDVQFQTGRRVEPMVSTPEAVRAALGRHYGVDAHDDIVEDLDLGTLVQELPTTAAEDAGGDDGIDPELERATRHAPVVRLVDRIIRNAIDEGASDIHVEETGADVRVRVRVDGTLRRTVDLPASSRRAILSRIKVLAGMDIAVRRRAQDGSLRFDHAGRRLTLRVSTLPVNGGEKAVVRILDSATAPSDLGVLGMSGPDLTQLRLLLRRGEGVVLAAGPTGSGKSTTLFAALSELDRDVQNIVTLEDPVEYRLSGASQVQVDRRAGLGFADALRAVLRQDPDVVMVGEIRDRETAEIAMAAAVTGHLVLSTIHTVDAPGAITRLLHMGVPPFLVAGGLSGVVAQRLVRRCCSACRGRGCHECGDGMRGRTGVYQVLGVSDEMRDEISGAGSSARLRRLAAEAGMGTLESDARRAVAAGLTTPHEIGRLLHAGAVTGAPCPVCGTVVPFAALACPGCGDRRRRACACSQPLERGWRWCPSCVRPVPPD
jgi:type IV pilus assembly protein PilB